MRRRPSKIAHKLLTGTLLTLPLIAAADVRTCLVVGVSDGDTITARCGTAGSYEQVKVRFNGIDAPEKKQPFGQRAKEAMSDLVYMKDVDLDCRKTGSIGLSNRRNRGWRRRRGSAMRFSSAVPRKA